MPLQITPEELTTSKEKIIVIMHQHHLGDCVAFEPIIPWLRKHYSDYKLAWATCEKNLKVLIAHPLLDYILPIESMKEGIDLSLLFPINIKTITYDSYQHDEKILPNNLLLFPKNKLIKQNYYFWDGLLGYFSCKAGLPKLTVQPNFYISPETILPYSMPIIYVVFHTASMDKERDWIPEKWNELAIWFIRQNIAVIELGWIKTITLESDRYYDLTKIDLHQTALIIKGAKCFFGVDSGLAHIANALKVDGVCLLGKLNRHGTTYNHYVPYTGYYSRHHIVRASSNCLASQITVREVVNFYLKKNTLPLKIKENLLTFFISHIYNRFWRTWYYLKET